MRVDHKNPMENNSTHGGISKNSRKKMNDSKGITGVIDFRLSLVLAFYYLYLSLQLFLPYHKAVRFLLVAQRFQPRVTQRRSTNLPAKPLSIGNPSISAQINKPSSNNPLLARSPSIELTLHMVRPKF
jgi:hypothetical protein